MNYITLRPHHFLCIRFWTGNGYSESFTAKMEEIIPLLKNGTPVKITFGPDDLCDCCPNKIDIDGKVQCKTQEKVLRYDSAVISSCNLKEGQITTWNEMHKTVTEKFFSESDNKENLFQKTCKDCSWFYICNNFSGTK